MDVETWSFMSDKFWGTSGLGDINLKQGDVIGLLLDCGAGTLTVKRNGELLGVAVTGLTGELCWAASMHQTQHVMRIAAIVSDH